MIPLSFFMPTRLKDSTQRQTGMALGPSGAKVGRAGWHGLARRLIVSRSGLRADNRAFTCFAGSSNRKVMAVR